MRSFLPSGLLFGAAVAALAISLSAGPSSAAGEKGAMMAPKPAGAGFCTARVNALKWGHMYWRTSTGTVLPTLAMCYDAKCPGKC